MKRQTKKVILTETIKLLAAMGPKEMTTDSVAKAVGVMPSALYKHYKNKPETIKAAIAHQFEITQADASEHNVKLLVGIVTRCGLSPLTREVVLEELKKLEATPKGLELYEQLEQQAMLLIFNK